MQTNNASTRSANPSTTFVDRNQFAYRTPRKWTLALVPIAYLLIGIAAYWPLLGGISRHPFIKGWDYEQSIWFLAWIPHALAHGLNPFFSNAILVPLGANLAQNTASPFLGLATVPLSPFMEPMERANLLVLLSMPLSATSAFYVLRRWEIVGPAAALGGLIFGFSPYMLVQNVELMFLPLVPLIVLLVVSIVQGRSPWVRLGIALGLLTTVQFFISPEVLTIVMLFAAAGTVLAAVRLRSIHLKVVWRPLFLAFAIAGTLLVYPIWMMIAGPQHFTGRAWPTMNYFHNDLLSFVVPGSEQRVSLGLRSVGDHLGGASGASGAGGYIGMVLIAIAGYLAWRSWRRLRMQLAVVLMFGAMVLSLGPYLAIDGRQTHFPLPFLIFDQAPFLDNILPYRVCFVISACLGAVIAFGLDDLLRSRAARRSSPSYRRIWAHDIGLFAVTVFGVLIAVPPPARFSPNLVSAPTAVTLPAAIRQAVPTGDPVAITFPYAWNLAMQPMQWQFNDGFQFRLLGGYAYHPSPSGGPSLTPAVMRPRRLQDYLLEQEFQSANSSSSLNLKPPALDRALVSATRATLASYDVRLVLVDNAIPGSSAVVALFRAALGPPSMVKGSFTVWIGTHEPL